MKKETGPIVAFYIMYFIWIFTLTYLTAQTKALNYFSTGVILFYFILLRESGDLIWFVLACLIPLILTAVSYTSGSLNADLQLVLVMPIWLPLAWGTTILALRKFYIVMNG